MCSLADGCLSNFHHLAVPSNAAINVHRQVSEHLTFFLALQGIHIKERNFWGSYDDSKATGYRGNCFMEKGISEATLGSLLSPQPPPAVSLLGTSLPPSALT